MRTRFQLKICLKDKGFIKVNPTVFLFPGSQPEQSFNLEPFLKTLPKIIPIRNIFFSWDIDLYFNLYIGGEDFNYNLVVNMTNSIKDTDDIVQLSFVHATFVDDIIASKMH